MTLKLGLPSKGRLQSAAIDWFAGHGVTLERTGQEREYAAQADGVPGLELVLLSAAEIPRELAAGRVHLGVTGQDVVAEAVVDADAVRQVKPLGFGAADLVVAVPAVWVDVATMADLDAVASEFRAAHGQRLRVATKYHRLVRAFFRRHGVADYRLVDSLGATEGTVKNLTAEAVADITSSGATLRDNHLKLLDDGLILRSEATLFAARDAVWDPAALATAEMLARRLGPALPQGFRAIRPPS